MTTYPLIGFVIVTALALFSIYKVLMEIYTRLDSLEAQLQELQSRLRSTR